jgi:hypothetical protein
MSLQNIADIASIAESIFVVISVLLILHQLQINNKLTRAANTRSLVDISSPFNLQLIQDRKVAELWVQGSRNFDSMDEVDQYRYRSVLIWWLILHENIFYQWRRGLIDYESYNPWNRDLQEFIIQQNIPFHWQELRHNYQAEFVSHVDSLIKKHPGYER